MKMYLNVEQTAKLIELGFEKPKGWCVNGISSRLQMYKHKEDDEDFNYSIGELLSFLPRKIYRDYNYYKLSIFNTSQGWYVLYAYFGDGFMWTIKRETKSTELIDAIFEMLIKLKEEGVI